MRFSLSLALRWRPVDGRLHHFILSEIIVLREHEVRTKTSTARAVSLNSRSRSALQAMKAHTLMKSLDGFVFLDPRTGARFTDDEPPREMYWRPTLRRLGIRYRSPYETRHTYATIMLMSGVTPAFAAKQMGHTIQMFLTTYAKWIDGGQNAVEMGKLEGAITNSSLALPQKSAKRAK
ncbi:tyrosine-type recombinase/integrase [Roseateles amylovorans]|uniref:Tyrosine-type recombinase/integrase n=1 Tax=Roseateles amylovorans TaxID=2978473 RepID=A0ABY6AT62_9BURK|nr:tyrosine-type recombinase/integrase [Roseateles amylovorans]UXH76426.1 tyrosine-type recombinase/integrase [Roseateles amylovorans]